MRQLEQTGEEYVPVIYEDLRNPLIALIISSERLWSMLSQKGMEQEASKAESILRNVRRLDLMIQELA